MRAEYNFSMQKEKERDIPMEARSLLRPAT